MNLVKGRNLNMQDRRLTQVLKTVAFVAMALAVPATVLAAVVIPHTFSSGAVISSSDMNDNFTTVANAINTHDHFGQTWTNSSAGAAGLAVKNTSNGGTLSTGGTGIYAENASDQFGAANYAAVVGHNTLTDTAANGVGVIGWTESGVGSGVAGFASATSTAVLGYTQGTGSALKGIYAGATTGTSLELNNGALLVTGTNKTAFSLSTNTCLDTTTTPTSCVIDNPMTNADPNVLLIVTESGILTSSTLAHPYGVYESAADGKWRIRFVDGANMVAGISFNVLVVKTGP